MDKTAKSSGKFDRKSLSPSDIKIDFNDPQFVGIIVACVAVVLTFGKFVTRGYVFHMVQVLFRFNRRITPTSINYFLVFFQLFWSCGLVSVLLAVAFFCSACVIREKLSSGPDCCMGGKLILIHQLKKIMETTRQIRYFVFLKIVIILVKQIFIGFFYNSLLESSLISMF